MGKNIFEEFSFLLRIGDICWDPQMKFVVVTGTIICGTISKNDTIELINDKGSIQLICLGVEMNGKITNYAVTGDSIGLMLKFIQPNDIRIGNFIAKRKAQTSSNVIKMNSQGGVFCVPCQINGIEIKAIFDTGASDITMSLTEAKFMLKQGLLKERDIIGTEKYTVADGSIHEGTVVNLREVVFGGKILKNVKASIVGNEDAPVLLGQTALSRLGKITIDYSNNTITFE